MAKKARKAVASKARKTKRKTKTSASKKRPTVKARRKVSTPTKAKPATVKPAATKPAATKPAATKPAATKKPTGQPIAIAKRPESFSHKVAGAFEAVVDTLVDAEELHHKLEPEISREPE
jgi:ribonuclease R